MGEISILGKVSIKVSDKTDMTQYSCAVLAGSFSVKILLNHVVNAT